MMSRNGVLSNTNTLTRGQTLELSLRERRVTSTYILLLGKATAKVGEELIKGVYIKNNFCATMFT
jgi:hypothetical protein